MTNSFDLMPYITEKSSADMTFNTFTFLLVGSANKIELKSYLTHKYDVEISKVNVLSKPSKTVRRGKTTGKTKSFKKVLVTLSSQKNIEKLKELY